MLCTKYFDPRPALLICLRNKRIKATDVFIITYNLPCKRHTRRIACACRMWIVTGTRAVCSPRYVVYVSNAEHNILKLCHTFLDFTRQHHAPIRQLEVELRSLRHTGSQSVTVVHVRVYLRDPVLQYEGHVRYRAGNVIL